jgi:hypothetical protein
MVNSFRSLDLPVLSWRTDREGASCAEAAQFVDDALAHEVAQFRGLFRIEASAMYGLKNAELDILSFTEDPGMPGEGGVGALDYQRENRLLLADRELKWAVVEWEHLAIERACGFAHVRAVDGDIACQAQHRADERQAEQLDLGHPLCVNSNVTEDWDIGERLMITDDNVGLRGIEMFKSCDVNSPRVDLGEEAAKASKPARGLYAPRVAIEQPHDAH